MALNTEIPASAGSSSGINKLVLAAVVLVVAAIIGGSGYYDPRLLVAIKNTLLWLAVTGGLTVVAIWAYVQVTPCDEFALIRDGNSAAGASLSGALIGFVLPLAAVIVHTGRIADLLVWAVVAFALQLLVYFVVELIKRDLRLQIERNNVAAGAFLGACSLAAGILNAACLIP